MCAKVDEHSFKIVKAMIAGGATTNKCCELTGMSDNTINRIKRTGSLSEYKDVIKQIGKRQAEQKKQKKKEGLDAPDFKMLKNIADKQHPIVYHASSYDAEVQMETNQLLEKINNKLAFIIKELTGKESEV